MREQFAKNRTKNLDQDFASMKAVGFGREVSEMQLKSAITKVELFSDPNKRAA